jgi:hypothetical protein
MAVCAPWGSVNMTEADRVRYGVPKRFQIMLSLSGTELYRPGFAFDWWSPSLWMVKAPHLFLMLFPAAMAMGPWIRWSRRFTLRTLLIATTLVAVVLGAIVYAVR